MQRFTVNLFAWLAILSLAFQAPAHAVAMYGGPASSTSNGYVTTGTQTFAGNKTFTGSVTLGVTSVSNFTITGTLGVSGTSTFNKTAEVSVSEVIARLTVSDDAIGKIEFGNTTAAANTLIPQMLLVSAGASTGGALNVQGTTDSGTNAILQVQTRIGSSTAVTTRPLVKWYSGSNEVLSFLPLNSGANLALSWGTQAQAAPTLVTSRSVGTRAIWYNNFVASTSTDYATGVDSGVLWNSVPVASSSYAHAWYAGSTQLATLIGDGRFTTTGARIRKLRVATTTPVTVNGGTDDVVVCKLGTPAAVAVSITATPATGHTVTIKDGTGDAAANNITITPGGGKTIDGAATAVISTNYGRVVIIYNGTEWNQIN